MDWEKKWARHPRLFAETDFMRQVEMTVGGEPRSQEQFHGIVRRIAVALELRSDDALLDICCGNGLITTELAKDCATVVGVDFSPAMIEIANKYHRRRNTTFFAWDALDLAHLPLQVGPPFDKVLCYGSAQYFSRKSLARLLDSLLPLISESAVILLGAIPDAERRWHFFDTPKKRLDYIRYRLRRRDAFGTWWRIQTIRRLCAERDLDCEPHVLERSTDAALAHYRFDVKITRRPTRS
jgi:SAM-dependent methyltransferase